MKQQVPLGVLQHRQDHFCAFILSCRVACRIWQPTNLRPPRHHATFLLAWAVCLAYRVANVRPCGWSAGVILGGPLPYLIGQ